MTSAPRKALQDSLSVNAKTLEGLHGLYLGGSFGRGVEDDWSDLDSVAVAEPDQIADLVNRWIALVSAQTEIVYTAKRLFPATALVNLITQDWVRCDLFIETSERFKNRAQDGLLVVLEHTPLYTTLPLKTTPPEIKPDALTAAVEGFLRVLGLSHLAYQRDDPFTAQWGVALLRDQIRIFNLALVPSAGLAGALSLMRELPKDRAARLEDLPVGGADMATILKAQVDLAQRFLPDARVQCDHVGARWPSDFVTATSGVLRGVMDKTFCDWLARQAG